MGFSWRKKFSYYSKRVADKSLSCSQRDYASSFLCGFYEVDDYNKKHGYESIENHKSYVRQSYSLISLNKKYGGDIASFAGNAAAHEKAVDMINRKNELKSSKKIKKQNKRGSITRC